MEREISIENINLILNIFGIIFTGALGAFSFFWIRPADKRLRKLESELSLQDSRREEIQKALIESRIAHSKEVHRRVIDACTLTYRAFLKVYSSSSILICCESLHDLYEIDLYIRSNQGISNFAQYLEKTFIPHGWQTSCAFSEAEEVEPFVPKRIWELYLIAKALVTTVQFQIHELPVRSDETLVRKDKIWAQIFKAFPEAKESLEKYGTSYYMTIMELCKQGIIREIRTVCGLNPIDNPFLAILDKEASIIFRNDPLVIPKEFQCTIRPESEKVRNKQL